jgi:hypothetical protein
MLLDHAPPMTLWLVLAGVGVVVAVGQLVTGPNRERRVQELAHHQGVRVAAAS